MLPVEEGNTGECSCKFSGKVSIAQTRFLLYNSKKELCIQVKCKPNLQTISDQLGISRATVSKVLNGYPQVNADTREAVLKCAREMGYHQGRNAAVKMEPDVKRVGLPSRTPCNERDDFYGDYQVMMGFRDEAQRFGIQIILLPNIPTSTQTQTSLETLIAPYRLDGLLISGLRMNDPYFEQLTKVKLPVVLWDIKVAPAANISSVSYDSLRGAQMAVEHLLALGHRRIGFFNGPRYAQICYDRLDGYHLALANAGIMPDPALERWAEFTDNGIEAAAYFLKQKVTAVFCSCDNTAVGLIRQFKVQGYKVPRDISVVGYDDSPLATAVSPALTTISQDFSRIGQIACGMMRARLVGLPLHNETVLPKLIVRNSTGPVSVQKAE